jgi:hypothetical protein
MNTNVGKEMWLWLPDICAYLESLAIDFRRSHRGEQTSELTNRRE